MLELPTPPTGIWATGIRATDGPIVALYRANAGLPGLPPPATERIMLRLADAELIASEQRAHYAVAGAHAASDDILDLPEPIASGSSFSRPGVARSNRTMQYRNTA